MDTAICKICGREMVFYSAGAVGDPAYVCPTDDAAHRAHAADCKARAEALLRAARETPPGPSPEALAEIGARFRPDPKAVEAVVPVEK